MDNNGAVDWIKHIRTVHFYLLLICLAILAFPETRAQRHLRDLMRISHELVTGHNTISSGDHWMINEAQTAYDRWSEKLGWQVKFRSDFELGHRWYFPSRVSWRDATGAPCYFDLPEETQFEPNWLFPPLDDEAIVSTDRTRAVQPLSRTVVGLAPENESSKEGDEEDEGDEEGEGDAVDDIKIRNVREHWDRLHKVKHIVTAEGVAATIVQVGKYGDESYTPEQERRFGYYLSGGVAETESKSWSPDSWEGPVQISKLFSYESFGSFPEKRGIATVALQSGIVELERSSEEERTRDEDQIRELLHNRFLIWRTTQSLALREEANGPIYAVQMYCLAPMLELEIEPLGELSLRATGVASSGSFKQVFPDLWHLSELQPDATLGQLESADVAQLLDEQVGSKEKDFPIFGISVPRWQFITWGSRVVLALLIYFALHLHGFRKHPRSIKGELAIPWIGIYDLQSARLGTFLTVIVIPAYAIFHLQWPRAVEPQAIRDFIEAWAQILIGAGTCFVIFIDLALLRDHWDSRIGLAWHKVARFLTGTSGSSDSD